RANILISTCSSTVSMALQKGQRLREVGQFEVAEVGQIKSAGDKPDSEARYRLIRTEVAGVAAIVALEISLLLQS
ncbi:hypothetical protein C9409_14440, partial [Xanthomonas vasicola pv. vasculorum]